MIKPSPRIPFFLNYSTALLLVLALVTARCNKEKDNQPTDTAKTLSIKFSATSISMNLVDSAVALFAKGTNVVKKTLEKTNDGFSTGLGDLATGSWSVQVYMYARIANDNHPRRYDLAQTITLETAEDNIEYAAPVGKLADEWKTRVIMAEADKSIVFIVALDPVDPYYDLQVKTTHWDNIYIDRIAYFPNPDGSGNFDGGSWECGDDCFDNGSLKFDPNIFSLFSQRMAGKAWTRTEIFGDFMNVATGEEKIFYYVYNK